MNSGGTRNGPRRLLRDARICIEMSCRWNRVPPGSTPGTWEEPGGRSFAQVHGPGERLARRPGQARLVACRRGEARFCQAGTPLPGPGAVSRRNARRDEPGSRSKARARSPGGRARTGGSKCGNRRARRPDLGGGNLRSASLLDQIRARARSLAVRRAGLLTRARAGGPTDCLPSAARGLLTCWLCINMWMTCAQQH